MPKSLQRGERGHGVEHRRVGSWVGLLPQEGTGAEDANVGMRVPAWQSWEGKHGGVSAPSAAYS